MALDPVVDRSNGPVKHQPRLAKMPSTTKLLIGVFAVFGLAAIVGVVSLAGFVIVRFSDVICEHMPEKCQDFVPPLLMMVDPVTSESIGCWRQQRRLQMGVQVGNKLIQAALWDGLRVRVTGQATDDPTIEPFSTIATSGRSFTPPETIGTGTGYAAVNVDLPDRLRQHPVMWAATVSTLRRPDIEQPLGSVEFGPCLFSLSGERLRPGN